MRRWADLEEAAPELAALGRERIEQFRFVFIRTLRRDGGPLDGAVFHQYEPETSIHHMSRWTPASGLGLSGRTYL